MAVPIHRFADSTGGMGGFEPPDDRNNGGRRPPDDRYGPPPGGYSDETSSLSSSSDAEVHRDDEGRAGGTHESRRGERGRFDAAQKRHSKNDLESAAHGIRRFGREVKTGFLGQPREQETPSSSGNAGRFLGSMARSFTSSKKARVQNPSPPTQAGERLGRTLNVGAKALGSYKTGAGLPLIGGEFTGHLLAAGSVAGALVDHESRTEAPRDSTTSAPLQLQGGLLPDARLLAPPPLPDIVSAVYQDENWADFVIRRDGYRYHRDEAGAFTVQALRPRTEDPAIMDPQLMAQADQVESPGTLHQLAQLSIAPPQASQLPERASRIHENANNEYFVIRADLYRYYRDDETGEFSIRERARLQGDDRIIAADNVATRPRSEGLPQQTQASVGSSRAGRLPAIVSEVRVNRHEEFYVIRADGYRYYDHNNRGRYDDRSNTLRSLDRLLSDRD